MRDGSKKRRVGRRGGEMKWHDKKKEREGNWRYEREEKVREKKRREGNYVRYERKERRRQSEVK